MSNFLLRNPEAVHIHIPKTGGSTIRIGVWGGKNNGGYEGPRFGEMPKEWEKYWKFAVVRHPTLRWWSAYRDFKHLRGYKGSPDDFAKVTLDTSIQSVRVAGGVTPENIRHHTVPMMAPELCLDYADDVYRYETNFDEVVKAICEKVGRPMPEELPRLRETPPTVEDALSRDVEKRLIEFYSKDFKELGYVP